MGIVFLVLIGLLVGIIAGITGASGILVLVPVLSVIFPELSMPIILGTSLIIDVIVSMVVSSTYSLSKNTEVRKIFWILIGTIIGTQIGAYLIISIPRNLVISVISFGMIAFGFKMFKNQNEHKSSNDVNFSFQPKPGLMFFLGVVVGLSTGIFGAGGGIMIFIILFYVLKFPLKKAVGTSTFIMIFTAFFGAIGYVYHSNFNAHLCLVIGLFAVIGGFLSSIFANRAKEGILSRIIGIIFVISAAGMFLIKVVLPLLKP
jgi:uncharacterized protein